MNPSEVTRLLDTAAAVARHVPRIKSCLVQLCANPATPFYSSPCLLKRRGPKQCPKKNKRVELCGKSVSETETETGNWPIAGFSQCLSLLPSLSPLSPLLHCSLSLCC